MTEAPNFAKLVPGFDFLQSLASNAGSVLPGLGQWVAPTLNPDEIGKRIDELRTVQFWLEQNARLIGTTIQALEVQRMTLSTLRTMNVQMDDLRESLTIRPADGASRPETAAKTAATPTPKPAPEAAAPAAAKPAAGEQSKARGKAEAAAPAAAAPGVVDPMQWWNALTQQFAQIAGSAMRDVAAAGAATGAKASGAPTEAGAPPAKKARPRKRAEP